MLVTEVEILRHEDAHEMAKMLDWLTTHNEKFLFDTNQRVSYGFRTVNVDWDQRDVRVDRKCRTGPYIDL